MHDGFQGRRPMRMGGGMPEEPPQLDSFGAPPPMSRMDIIRQKFGNVMRPARMPMMPSQRPQRMPMQTPMMPQNSMMPPPSPEQDMFAMPRRPRPEMMDILAGRI